MTATMAGQDHERARDRPMFDVAPASAGEDEASAAITSEYAEAMRHLIDPTADEGPVETGASEYCYPSEYGEEEEEAPRVLTGDWN